MHLDETLNYQVNTSCEMPSRISNASWFVLPPLMAYYYKTKNPFYKPLPPYRNDCTSEDQATMQFIYPKANSTFFLPKDFDGTTNALILKLAHSKPESTVYWYVDKTYVGSTTQLHDLAILPKVGKHLITALDTEGNELKRWIEIAE